LCVQGGTPKLDWGDQGDGTFRNPVLKCDFSDPDILRVGGDFYLIASDFHFVGMQVLHSRDLVNWEIVNQIFSRLSMDEKYDQMRGYGQGTWAPAWGYHAGRFYAYVCTPFDGLFMWHTDDPANKWSEMITVKKVERWEDPCPFWDEDGQAYLIHSHKGAGPLILHKMSSDGTQLLDDGVEIYRGPTAEGPKLIRRRGFYYIFLPEGGVATGWQTVLRSKNIYGPYERRIVLPPGSPHQGGVVELASGESWFVGFKSTGHLGRVTHLLPVKWPEDGWPVFGENGRPLEHCKKPDVGQALPIQRPPTSDEFDSPSLSQIWQWNHNPVNEAWSLVQRPGWLRLRGLPADSLAAAHNTLTQKLWDQRGQIDVLMDVANLSDGQRAGFAFQSGDEFAWIGALRRSNRIDIAWENGQGPALPPGPIRFRGTYKGDKAKLWHSVDGIIWTQAGGEIQLKFAFWKGARPTLFCYGPGAGWADVDYFRYEYSSGQGI
jgi:beta-xylosidase